MKISSTDTWIWKLYQQCTWDLSHLEKKLVTPIWAVGQSASLQALIFLEVDIVLMEAVSEHGKYKKVIWRKLAQFSYGQVVPSEPDCFLWSNDWYCGWRERSSCSLNVYVIEHGFLYTVHSILLAKLKRLMLEMDYKISDGTRKCGWKYQGSVWPMTERYIFLRNDY